MKKKGYVLPLAIFTAIFIFIMLYILLNVVINQIPQTDKSIQQAKVEYALEAGVQEGIFILISNIQNDIEGIYDVSYKTTPLLIQQKQINQVDYKIDFQPNTVEYNLQRNQNNKYYITSIKNNAFTVISTDLKTGSFIKYTLQININNDQIEWQITDISRNR